MKFGFFGVNAGVLSEPATMVAAATTAEAAGWESIWTGEHLVAASPQRPPSPVRPDTHFVDQVASLAPLAAQTTTLRLGPGIVILPQRNPVVLAKELASVDVLSSGRLEAGFGVGYVPDEFDAIGVPFSERGARMDDHIDALRAMWRGDLEFEGRFTSWHGVEAYPRPVEPHGPPIHVGGGSEATFRRAVLRADGWYGFLSTLKSTGSAMDALDRGMAELDRPAHLGRIQVSVTPSEPVDRDIVRRYEDLGVDRLILVRDFRDVGGTPNPERANDVLRFIDEAPGRLGFA